jgi:hypothetical protein
MKNYKRPSLYVEFFSQELFNNLVCVDFFKSFAKIKRRGENVVKSKKMHFVSISVVGTGLAYYCNIL